MSWKHLIKGLVICAKCGNGEMRRAVKQKFCSRCSPIVERRRKLEWQRTHPRESPGKNKERNAKRNEILKARGVELSVSASKGWALLPDRSNAAIAIRVDFPMDGFLSKNAIASIGTVRNVPFVFVRKEVRERRAAIAGMIQRALRGRAWPQSKTWLDIVVQHPEHRRDAVNVVDTLCDAIKEGIEVDDRWYSIGRLDWEIVKRDPKVLIQVSTYATGPEDSCRFCGKIGPRADYTADGCRPCTNSISSEKRGTA